MSAKLRIGDVFQVPMESSGNRFFQHIADDTAQLHSNVVRVFRDASTLEESIDIERIIRGTVAFHAHVLLPIGVKLHFWQKIGHADPPAKIDVLFRSSNDYGNPKISRSKDWHVWKVNGPVQAVGELLPKYQSAEIGAVVPPDSLIYRMRNGEYDFKYPAF